jgi:DNA-binding MarR family transcriptional regulator
VGAVSTSPLERIAESIAAAFRASRAARLHDRAAEQAGVPRLDRTAFALLRAIEAEPLRVSELAARLGLDASTVSRKVAALEQLDLIARTGDERDRRAARLSLAPAGMRVLRRLRREWLRTVEELVDDWSESDRRAFADLLDRFASGLEARAVRRPAGE